MNDTFNGFRTPWWDRGSAAERPACFRVFDVEKKAFDREYANADKSDWLDRNPKSHFLYADTGHFDVMVRN